MSKKLGKMKQTNGKVETFKPTTLAQLWGENGSETYHTMNEAEYEASLSDMNMSDLQRHSASIGVMPHENRERLTKRLLGQFKQHVAKYRFPENEPTPTKKISKDVLKILAEGR